MTPRRLLTLLAACLAPMCAPAAVKSGARAAAAPSATVPAAAPAVPMSPRDRDEADFSKAAELRIGKQPEAALALLLDIEQRAATQEVRGEAEYQQGLILEETGRTAEALAAYASVVKENGSAPAAPHAQLNWAHLKLKLGNLDEASEGYRVLAVGYPRFAGAALLAEGGLEEDRGRTLDAMLAYRNLLRNYPQAPEVADARTALGALCAKTLAAPSTTPWEGAYMRGDCLMDQDKLAEAQRVYEAALKRPVSTEAQVELLMALGGCLDAQDKPGAAERVYRRVVRAAPKTARAAAAQMQIVQGALDRGKLADAVSELTRIVKDYPGTGQMAQAQFMIGSCEESLHDRKKAEEAWRRVLEIAPNTAWSAEAQQNLVRLLEQAP